MITYFIRSGRQISGPYSGRQIREMASSGRLAESDEISSDKVRWVPARDIPGLCFTQKIAVRTAPVGAVSVIAPSRPQTPAVTTVAPVVQMHASPVIHVAAPRPYGNSLGIASMVLGILAFVICWIPILNLLGLPLSGLGLLLGIIGIVIAAVRRGSGIGFPIAGAAISGVALVIVIWMYVGVARVMGARPQSQQTSRSQSATVSPSSVTSP